MKANLSMADRVTELDPETQRARERERERELDDVIEIARQPGSYIQVAR